MAELKDIKGLGPAKIARLQAAGITDLRGLAELDLRTHPDVGVGTEVLKKAKQQARRLLEKEGQTFETAPYGEGQTDKPARKRPTAKAVPPAGSASGSTTNGAVPRKGFLARLLGRK